MSLSIHRLFIFSLILHVVCPLGEVKKSELDKYTNKQVLEFNLHIMLNSHGKTKASTGAWIDP